MSSELFLDAVQLHKSLTTEGDAWREWSACATDGDTDALIELVHDHKVCLSIYLPYASKLMKKRLISNLTLVMQRSCVQNWIGTAGKLVRSFSIMNHRIYSRKYR